jgi:ankyrin repeat protein
MSEPLLEDFAAAIELNDSVSINSLLLNGHVDANARLRRGSNRPALVHAARFASVDVVELLLASGARIDDVGDERQSACHAAAMRGDANVMKVLLAHRPNLALKDMDGLTALRLAMQMPFWRNEDGKCASLLIVAGASLDDLDRTELCRLAANSTTLIQKLVDNNVVVSGLRDGDGQSPLLIATRSRAPSLDVLSKLLDCGVDVEARAWDLGNVTCCSIAVEHDKADALRLFLLAGANVDDAPYREPLLHESVYWKRFKCMMLLLAAGADVAARDDRGRTALLVAAQERMMPFVHATLAAGADLDAVDENGKTPRLCLAEHQAAVDHEQVESARRDLARTRLDFVHYRAMDVCIGLQPLQLDALQVCEILQLSCGPLARLIAFHQWWKIATTVKHFHQH